MELKGQFKDAFHNYLHLNYSFDEVETTDDFIDEYPPAMQFGVFQDFGDSCGYDIDINKANGNYFYTIVIPKFDRYPTSEFSNRQQARNAAIEKLQEIYNKQTT